MVANVSMGSMSAFARKLLRGFAPLLFVFVFVLPGSFKVSAQTLDKLEIITSTGVHAFSVEVVRNEADREKGLMAAEVRPLEGSKLLSSH